MAFDQYLNEIKDIQWTLDSQLIPKLNKLITSQSQNMELK